MKNSKYLFVCLCLLGLSFSGIASAGLSRDSIPTLNLWIYGMYTTSDPLCRSGLQTTIPLSATPTTYNFAATPFPTLGTGAVARPIACVIFVLKNTVTLGWSAGTYTTTTSGSSDSVCNAGGSIDQHICRSATVAYPDKIVADAASIGLTLTTGSCAASPAGTEVIPVYISTGSKCTGNATKDAGTAGCGSPNAFEYPATTSDLSCGLKLVTPPDSTTLYLAVDPDQTVGASSGVCGAGTAPLFSFHN